MSFTQPVNELAPFKVTEDNGEIVIQVEEEGVYVSALFFPDGSVMTSASMNNPLPVTDAGTF